MESEGGCGKQTRRRTLGNLFSQKFCPLEPKTLVRAQSSSVSPGNRHSQDGTVPVLYSVAESQPKWPLERCMQGKPSLGSLRRLPGTHRRTLIKQVRKKTESMNKAFLNLLLQRNNTFEASERKDILEKMTSKCEIFLYSRGNFSFQTMGNYLLQTEAKTFASTNAIFKCKRSFSITPGLFFFHFIQIIHVILFFLLFWQ